MRQPVKRIIAIIAALLFTWIITTMPEDDPIINRVPFITITPKANVEDTDVDIDDTDVDADDTDVDADDTDADDADVDADDTDSDDEVEVVIAHDGYVEYSEDAVKKAIDEGKKVALFFHATRCSTCAVLEEDLLENEGTIDENIVIFKVDYDTEVDLKDRYVITSQHTVVYLDNNMDATTSIKGLNTTEELLEKFE